MNQISKVQLDQIITDAGTQARAALNEDVVVEYAEAIIAGADMPPVIVFHDGKRHILADGFHRYFAHVKARAMEISADVRKGTKRDAKWYSLGANTSHGLRRTNEDKRSAVRELLADKEWSKLSDREIAAHLCVAHSFVAAIRNPKVAERQAEHRKASAVREPQKVNRPVQVESDSTPIAKPSEAKDFPWETKTSKPVEKPEPQEEEGPTLAELVDELQRENEVLRKQLEAIRSELPDTDLRQQLARSVQLASHARREQGIAMDRAAQSQKREEFAIRMLRACGKAAGVADPNHTDPRDIVKAVQAAVRRAA